MEHTRNSETLAVLLRFLRRYWRIPAQVAGVLALLLTLLLALPFLPRFNGRVDASPIGPSGGSGGVVESLFSKGVGSPFDGPVAATAVQVGERVKKGDLLFTMDVTELQAQLVAAKADVAAAQALVREAQQARSEHLAPLRAQVRQLRSRLAAQQSAATAVAVAAEEFPAASEVEVVEPDQWVRAEQLEALEAALAGATAQLAESTSQWTPAIQDAEQQLAVALCAVKQLRGRLAMAERRSPMDGVVTSISVRAGQWVGAYQPVVRVDNPDGYRVVALVDKATRERMARGQTVPLSISGTPDRGKLEKVVAGWDKDLYSYWLWFKPSHPEKLRPGQAVRVDLEPAAPASPA